MKLDNIDFDFMFGIKILRFFEKNGLILGQNFVCPRVFFDQITTKILLSEVA